MEPKLIGGRIAQARKSMNFSQAQLAERLFISPQAVGKWERGESVPDIMTMDRLSKILEVDLNYFSGSTPPMDTEPASVGTSAERADASPSVEQKNKPRWDMSRGNWVDADFSGLKDLHEKFSSSNMKNCKFIGSDLSELLLRGNNIEGCDFSGADMRGSRLQDSHIVSNAFNEAVLKDAQFSNCQMKGCDLSGTDLTGATFTSTHFAKNSMTNVRLMRTTFKGTAIADTVFEGIVEDCYFEDCGFSKVTFRNARILNTFFKGPGLKRIQFIDCQADRMTYEFLKSGKADLGGITVVAG